MKVIEENGGYIVVGTYGAGDEYIHRYSKNFPTIQALENHIKLMLIAVQNYKGVTLQEDDIVVDDEPIDYSARYYHE